MNKMVRPWVWQQVWRKLEGDSRLAGAELSRHTDKQVTSGVNDDVVARLLPWDQLDAIRRVRETVRAQGESHDL